MDKEVVTALIGAGATILAAFIGKFSWDRIASLWTRRRNNIPEIMKTRWQAEWYFEDGTLYVRDQVTLEKWTKMSQFKGYGEVTHHGQQYKYPIVGEVAPSRMVALTYRAEKYPTQASFGTACLELSDNATQLKGYWAGRTSLTQNHRTVYTVRGGLVDMRKIKDLDKQET